MTRELSVILGRIEQVIDSITSEKISNLQGEELSKKALFLSTHKYYLSSELAELEYGLNMNEALRKQTWAEAYAKARQVEKSTSKDCEVTADNEVREMVKEEIELKKNITKLKGIRQDVSEITTTIQTRIGVLKQEKFESNQ
jgi:hypothetical protein